MFVLSTGRSGSTLVQRLLNCHQDLVVWGEHYGFLLGLGFPYLQMADPDQVLYPRRKEDNRGPSLLLPTLQDATAPLEWVNPWSLEEYKSQLKRFIDGYFGTRLREGQRWGFKEIRYNTLPVLRMLRDLYGDGRFVFIRRDPLEVTRSKVFAFVTATKWAALSESDKVARIEGMLKEAQDHYRVHDTFMEQNPGCGLLVHYEEVVARPRDVAARMLAHLSLDPDRFDWSLADQVMGSVITATRRDEAVTSLIRAVATATMGTTGSTP